MSSKKHWSPGGEVSVQSVERSDAGGWIVSGNLAPNGICPDCGLHSRRRHGWRHRRLQDYPAHGDGVTVALQVCRWRCLASACPRRIFSDQIASIARAFAWSTSRVGDIIRHLGHAADGRPAERILHRLGLGISDDKVLRQLKERAEYTAAPPTVIGIDDWSWRKSQTHGTTIVDLERRVVIFILEDRDVVTCTNWLKQNPDLEVISTDRCDLYAQAALQGAPQAKQVADRFHIVKNLRQAIEGQMNLHGHTTRSAQLSDADNITAAGSLLKSRLAHGTFRKAILTTIHTLRNQGLTCSEIGRRTGFPRRSIAKWLQFETPPDRRRAALKPTSPWYFEEFLSQSWKDGIRTGSALFRMLQERDYEGSQTHLQRLLAGWRRGKTNEGPYR